ncbi:MAG: hypothetical protein U0168_03785 [Nannocystaceae bacterium]
MNARARVGAGLVLVLACDRRAPPPESAPQPVPTPAVAPPVPAPAPAQPAATPQPSAPRLRPGVRPSSGCSASPRGGHETLALRVDGRDRSAEVVAPIGSDGRTPLPLVIAFHGLGGSGGLARRMFGLDAAMGETAVVAYPDGRVRRGREANWDLSATGEDFALFDALVQQLGERYCIDTARVFAVGHSYGATMASALGCKRAASLRGIAAVEGTPVLPRCDDRRVAALFVHGRDDRIVSVRLGEAARDAMLRRNDCDDTGATRSDGDATCTRYDRCAPTEPVMWCEHRGAALRGHMWPPHAAGTIAAFFDSLRPR